MKKYKILLFIIVSYLILLPNVYATGGGLRRASIKTCPDGVTYGMHSDGKGGTHWHRAATNGDNYYAVGDAIYSDPCPGNSGNKGTAESTHGGSNDSSSSNNTNSNSSNGNNNSNSSSNSGVSNVPPAVTKSDDATIKSITIDGKSIEIKDELIFETNSESIDINVITNHSKASVKINGDKDNLKAENKFEIIVTAEAGNIKTYALNVNRKPGISKTKLSLKINDISASFDNKNYYETTELFYTNTIKFTYTLSNERSSVKVLKNKKEIGKEDKIILGDNNYKFIVTDENGDSVEYTLKVTKEGFLGSVLIIVFGVAFMGGFVFLVYWLIKKIRNK